MTHAATALRTIATAVLILAGTAAVTGCAPPPDPPPARVAPGPTPTTTDLGELHLPIEAYMLTPAQSQRYETVSTAVLRACMRRYGFDYPIPASPTVDDDTGERYALMYRRYGVTDPVSVRTWGYHLPQRTVIGAARPAPPMLDVLHGRSSSGDAQVTTDQGQPVPRDGCLGEAQRLVDGGAASTLRGPGTAASGIVANIKAGSFAESMADPATTRVFARWSACMGEHGFQLADPMHAAEHLDSMDAPAPSRAEITQAVTDVTCKARTNLVNTWFAVESAYQRVEISTHQRELVEVSRERDSLLRRIEQLSREYPE